MARSYAENTRDREEKARVDLGLFTLTQIALLFMSSNASATHRLRAKVLELLEYVDESMYEDNNDLYARLMLARGIGRAVMNHGAKHLPQIEHRLLEDTDWAEQNGDFFAAYRGGTGHHVEGIVIENELSDENVKYIDEYVSTRMRYSHLWGSKAVFREIADRIESDDMGQISEFNDEACAVLEQLIRRMRAAKAIGNSGAMDFRTGDSSFEAGIRNAWTVRNQPQSVVRTGVRLLNDMLGGGYQGGRCYVHFGRSG